MIVKLIHKDGSIFLERINNFTWDTDDNTLKYTDYNDVDTTVKVSDQSKVYVYAEGGFVIFTRDLKTLQPIENFNV